MDRFREFLKNNRNVILNHGGKRYKAKTVSAVLQEQEKDCPCYYCHCGIRTKYAVEVRDDKDCKYFMVNHWSGCMTYSESISIHGFDHRSSIDEYIEHMNMFNKSHNNSEESNSY
jgi:hypothetical protein